MSQNPFAAYKLCCHLRGSSQPLRICAERVSAARHLSSRQDVIQILASNGAVSLSTTHGHERSTAPHGDVEIRRFRVTHPYHPLFQQEFELVSYRQDWGEDRVWFQDKLGRLHSLPTSWTDAGESMAKVAVARIRMRTWTVSGFFL